jgi:predicted membrane protein
MKAVKSIFIVCSICCFVAILKLPIEYYTFLRTIVSLGAAILIYNFFKQKNYALAIVFILVLILFNPLFPIYLHRKSIWIPLDVITGILFLLIGFYNKKEPQKEEKAVEVLPVQKTYSRDRIVSAQREIK